MVVASWKQTKELAASVALISPVVILLSPLAIDFLGRLFCLLKGDVTAAAIGGPLPAGPLAAGVVTPREEGMGELKQGYLEASNVELVMELVQMIRAQRAFEISSEAIQATDEMMQTVGQLRR